MIKKLQIKLIAVSMISMFIVLGVIVGALNVVNYTKIISDSDSILNVLAENDGKFPASSKKENQSATDVNGQSVSSKSSDSNGQSVSSKSSDSNGQSVSSKSSDSSSASSGSEPEHDNNGRKGGDLFGSPETPYESRFFSIALDSSGNATSAESMQIVSVTSDEAEKLAETIFASGKTNGFSGNYRFIVSQTSTGYRVICLDCTKSLSNFKNVLFISVTVSLLGLVAVFVLVVILSRRITKPIAESYDKQKEFITNASHEIKTPLAIISADAEVLEMESGENEWTDDIKDQTKRLTSLTNDLVFLSKMEESAPEKAFLEFPISDLVSDTGRSFLARAKADKKTLAIDVEPLISISGDEKSIEKLVSILMDNALKYSPSGGYIRLSLKKNKSRVILSVENTTKEELVTSELDHFFDRFYRADKSRNSANQGYGIGLSVARAVTEKHKGKIRAYAKDRYCLVIEVSFSS